MNQDIPTSLESAYGALLILIPAYNAGEAVGRVVGSVRMLSPDLAILVVDDGSTDATARTAKAAGAVVVSHAANMGKGVALRTGFDYFLRTDLKAVVTLDADGQHPPREIPNLIDRWLQTHADIIIGTRRRDFSRMPALRVVTNTLSSILVSLSAGRYIHDSQSGFRLISRRAIANVETSSASYGAESEILIKAVSRGYTVDSAPISTIYADERSYVHPVKQPIRFLWLIIRSFFWRFQHVGKK